MGVTVCMYALSMCVPAVYKLIHSLADGWTGGSQEFSIQEKRLGPANLPSLLSPPPCSETLQRFRAVSSHSSHLFWRNDLNLD